MEFGVLYTMILPVSCYFKWLGALGVERSGQFRFPRSIPSFIHPKPPSPHHINHLTSTPDLSFSRNIDCLYKKTD